MGRTILGTLGVGCVGFAALGAALGSAGCDGDLEELLRRAHHGEGGNHPPPDPDPPAMNGTAPRLVAPLSASALSTNLPTFRWELGANTNGAIVDVCADRACDQVVATIPSPSDTVNAVTPLPPGHLYWRARGTRKGKVNSAASATWEIFVPRRTASPATALGTRLDVDGDGFADYILDRVVLRGSATGFSGNIPLPPVTPSPSSTVGITTKIDAAAGDLDGDGLGDLLRIQTSSDVYPADMWTAAPLYGGATGFIAGASVTGAGPVGVINSFGAAGDVNGDGYADVLLKTGFDVVTYFGGASAVTFGVGPASATIIGFFGFGGDVDGDGLSDALSTSNGITTLLFTPGSPAGFANGAFAPIPLDPPPWVGHIAMVDADSDGYADLALTLADRSLALFAGSAAGIGATPFQILPAIGPCDGASCELVVALTWGHFNGDGFADLIVQRGPIVEVHYGVPNGVDPTGHALNLFPDGVIEPRRGAVGDVNGDGFDDLMATIYDVDPQTQVRTANAVLMIPGGSNGLPSTD